jgi:hypothetical protein
VKLLGRWLDGGERRSGGAASARGTASMRGGGRASGAESGGCGLGAGERPRARRLNRGGSTPGRAGPEPLTARSGAGAWPDSDLDPSLARGEDGPGRWGPCVSERKGRRREKLVRGER